MSQMESKKPKGPEGPIRSQKVPKGDKVVTKRDKKTNGSQKKPTGAKKSLRVSQWSVLINRVFTKIPCNFIDRSLFCFF